LPQTFQFELTPGATFKDFMIEIGRRYGRNVPVPLRGDETNVFKRIDYSLRDGADPLTGNNLT